MTFHNGNLGKLRAEIQEALNVIAKEHDLQEISLGNIRFDDSSFKSTVVAKTKPIAGKENQHVDARNARRLGLPEDIIGSTIIFRGLKYSVIKIDMKKRKYPVSIQKLSGGTTRYKISAEAAKSAVKRVTA